MMARKKKPDTFLAYMLRRKQDTYIYATVWVAMALIWLLFPGIVDQGGRYSASIKFIVIMGWPLWIGISFIVYRGWLSSPKRTNRK